MSIFKSILRFISNHAIWVLVIAYVYVRSLYWDLSPIWDGMAYFQGLLRAIQSPFDILNYGYDGHFSEGFFLVIGLPLKLFSQSFYFFNVCLTLFGVISLLAFYKIAFFFFKDYLSNVELTIITALFAFHPSVLSSLIHFNIDIGILTFFLLYWACLLYEKWIMATVCAVLLAFSKETAILLLPLPFLFCLLLKPSAVSMASKQWLKEFGKYFYNSSQETKVLVSLPALFGSLLKQEPEQMQWFKKNFITLAIPYVFVGLFILYKVFIRNQPAFWVLISSPYTTITGHYFSPDGRMLNYLGMCFVINFNWVLASVILGSVILLIIRRKHTTKEQLKRTKLFLLLLAALTFVLTLVRSWSDVRYLMPMIPVMILCVVQLSSLFVVPRLIRLSVLLLLLVLFSWEDIRTIDPLSKVYFGTFDFGSHKMLCISRRTNETFSSYGRDELVYNLEYLKLRQLLTEIFKDIKPNSQTCFVSNGLASWMTAITMDDNYNMTLQGDDLISPNYYNIEDVLNLKQLPGDIYLLDYPNSGRTYESDVLNKLYSEKTLKVYNIDGYRMNVIHYQKVM